jgi:putative FmdB family regulatory protein
MPIYEYKCTKCNREFEVMQKITDEPLSRCSECGGRLRKLITNTSFVLKGSGWYVTDYPSEARKKAMERKEPAEKGGKKKDGKSPSRKKETAKAK